MPRLNVTEAIANLYKLIDETSVNHEPVVITATDEEAQEFVLGLYEASNITFENLRAWLGENTKAL